MENVYELLKSLVVISNATKTRVDGDFLIVMSPSHSIQYFSDVAKDFFMEIDGKKTIDNIKDLLLREYDVAEAVLISDLTELIRDLQWKNLILLKAS